MLKAKVITIISCFYDLEDPNKFVSDLKKILAPNGLIVIQQNYLVSMLQQNAFDNIVHEHVEYYSLKSLEHLLNRHGLEVVDVELSDINGGSFRTYIKHKTKVQELRDIEEKFKIGNRFTYMLFVLKIRSLRIQIHNYIERITRSGKTVYLYGASTRGGTLLQFFDLNNTLIAKAVERNPEKFGKRIASLDIPIISEEQARKDKPDVMLILPWFFAQEFVKRESEYLQNGGTLLFPLPNPYIITKEGTTQL